MTAIFLMTAGLLTALATTLEGAVLDDAVLEGAVQNSSRVRCRGPLPRLLVEVLEVLAVLEVLEALEELKARRRFIAADAGGSGWVARCEVDKRVL
jgi:hypothetical protein